MNHLVFPLNDISKSDVKSIAKSFDIKLFEKRKVWEFVLLVRKIIQI